MMLNMLAIDLGASSGRVMRVGFDGNFLHLEEVRRFANHPLQMSNTLNWNIYALFQELKWGVLHAASECDYVVSIAIDSWAVDFGLIGPGGRLIGLPRHYRDPANLDAFRAVTDTLGRGALFDRTGIQMNPINSLYQLYALSREEPEVLATAERLLMIPDLLNYFLTGQSAAEFTNATTTQFLTPTGGWDTELLTRLGLPVHVLPNVVDPATILGPLRDRELLELSSLGRTQVVHTASHDTASAVLSVPHAQPDFIYISSGTWSLMGTVVPEPVINHQTQAFNLTNEGGVGNYRLLKNVMGLWLLQELQRELRAAGESAEVEDLVRAAKRARPFVAVFDPDDTRLLQPVRISDTITQICCETGQQPPADTAALVRSILESLALKYRQVLDELKLVTGKHYDVVHIVGGGAQNRLLSQFTANSMQCTVLTGPVEASGIGNALGQLIAMGEINASDVTHFARQSERMSRYQPESMEAWDTAYQWFRTVSQQQAARTTMI